MLQKMTFIVLLLLIVSQPALSLIGFDCGGQHLNITTVSLLGAGECNLEHKTPLHLLTFVRPITSTLRL